jgi:hypothetical protein
MVLAMANLVLDSMHTVQAKIDLDGLGPLPERLETVPAHFFIPPVGDPVQLVADGFEELAQ